MHTLKTHALSVLLVAAAPGLLLLLGPPTAHGQTTYSSPVRVVNTPLPVSGTVNVTAGANLPVSIQGTPAVTIGNPSSQPVPMTLTEQYYSETLHINSSQFTNISGSFSPSADVLFEAANVDCTLPQGQRVAVSVSTYTNTSFPHAVPLQYQGTFGTNDRYSGAIPMKSFHKTNQSIGQALPFATLTRSSSSGTLDCHVTVDGTLK